MTRPAKFGVEEEECDARKGVKAKTLSWSAVFAHHELAGRSVSVQQQKVPCRAAICMSDPRL
eukprot:1161493-Pelagomonas_calceolata.AAC.10